VDRPADSLPDDIDVLRALASTAIAERDAAIAERDRLIELNDRLRRLLRKAQGFEAKSERLAKLHPDQLNLALEDIEQTIAKAEAIEEKTQAVAVVRKRRINRGAATHSRDGRARRHQLPLLQAADARDRQFLERFGVDNLSAPRPGGRGMQPFLQSSAREPPRVGRHDSASLLVLGSNAKFASHLNGGAAAFAAAHAFPGSQ
jgi:hypothetical protein